jgi:hypothetical protein
MVPKQTFCRGSIFEVGSGTSDDAKVSKWKRDLSEDVELE